MNTKLIIAIVALALGRAAAADSCAAAEQGYSCCKNKTTIVEITDSTGIQYGVEDGHLCGISKVQCKSGDIYNCCKKCKIVYTDTEDWGVENNDWCSIPYACYENNDKTTTTTTKKTTTTTTTTTTKKTTTTTTTTTKSSEPTVCAKLAEPCGGDFYPNAPNCCESGLRCVQRSKYFSECVEEDSEDTTTKTTAVEKTTEVSEPTEASEAKCAAEFEMCGGTNYPDAPDCCEGSVCDRRYTTYHQCIPDYMYYQPPPPPPFNDGCARAYDYCQEEGYPDCCAPGFHCVLNDKNRHQCLEDPSQPPPGNNPYGPNPYGPQNPTTTTTTTAAPTPTECADAYYPCGGSKFPDAPNCCKPGYFCVATNPVQYKCLPEDEIDEDDIILPNPSTPTTTAGKTTTTTTTTKKTTTTPKPTTTTTTTTTTKKSTTTTTTTTTTTKKTTTTTTKKTTTTTTTTTSPKPSSNSNCAKAYGFCGGSGFPDAPSCCEEGTYCWKGFEHYHLCVPNEHKEFYVEQGEPVTRPANTNNVKCAAGYQTCGGAEHPDAPPCCEAGFLCLRRNPVVHSCIPESAFEEQNQNQNQNQNQPTTTTTTTTVTTTKTKTTTTTTTKASTPTSSQSQCSKAFEPCGGYLYPNAKKCCESGSTCVYQDDGISQCIPDYQLDKPDEEQGECAKVYEMCGGSGYPNAPKCCESGATCVQFNEFHHQCIPSSAVVN